MMSEDTNDFWQSHSLKYLEMAFRTDRCEILATPDGYGKKTRSCGDSIEIFLKTCGDILNTVSYYTNGCMNTLVAPIRLSFSSKANPSAKHGRLHPKPSPTTWKPFRNMTFTVRKWLLTPCIWRFSIFVNFSGLPGKKPIKPVHKLNFS